MSQENLPVESNPGYKAEMVVQGDASWRISTDQPAFWCTLDKSIPANKRTILRAMQDCEFNAESLLKACDGIFSVEHILSHPVEVTDKQTGEKIPTTRVVLIDPEGATCSFVSGGVMKSLQILADLYGVPPWKGGIKCRLVQFRTGIKNLMYRLDPIDEVLPGETEETQPTRKKR